MLYLMRKQDESIIINNNIELKVIEIKGKSVKLGFNFPKGASVLRKELYDKIMAENEAALKMGQSVSSDLLSSLPLSVDFGMKSAEGSEDSKEE
ncbi:MAG: carbon storage regulator [Alphaproteobacteria bacterium CG11_big_fil_rev_8_21_14_0_20_39_49]|nr:MAG: carbon storage regulator [Alphaproteobacteria bacterium CG11_big_fil_rev_8_21_14_0_20_39_49]